MASGPRTLARHAAATVATALADTRAVALVGPRQAGKSTLVRSIVEKSKGAAYLTLDDDGTRALALADPAGFVRGRAGLLAIDEVQRVPGLLLGIKSVVDADPRPGRFLLTGSAHLFAVKDVADSLAGRMEIVELWPFSQGEIEGRREHFVDLLFAGRALPNHRSSLSKRDYLERVCRGGFPEVIGRRADRRRAWFRSYVQAVVAREIPGVADVERLAELPRLVRLCAARQGAPLNVAALSRDAGLPERTTHRYLDALEAVFLIRRIPPWAGSLTAREVRAPKLYVTDSGLAANLRGASPESLSVPQTAQGADGPLLEGFVIGELQRQAAWSEAQPRVHHYRDRNGLEVDAVLESDEGSVVGIEVKAAGAVTADDATGLRFLRDKLGQRFRSGAILHSGQQAVSLGDRISALPMDALWTTVIGSLRAGRRV